MQIIFEYTGQFPIKVEQYARKELFRVTYGQQVRDKLTYREAARELGECIFHNQACMGTIWMK